MLNVGVCLSKQGDDFQVHAPCRTWFQDAPFDMHPAELMRKNELSLQS